MKSGDLSLYGWRGTLVLAVLIAVPGCKRKETDRPSEAGAPLPADVASVRDALVSGMEVVTPSELTERHIGQPCVVTAHTPPGGSPVGPPPPPLGMVRRIGRTTTIYKGQIESISADRLTVRAPYPGSDQYKIIEVPRAHIESVHLSK